MSRVGFVTHPRRAAAVDAAMWLDRLLSSEGVETVRLPDDGHRPPEGADGLDLVVSVGGDGTFLRAAFVELGCRLSGAGREGRPARLPHRGRARGRAGPDPERAPRRRDDRGAARRHGRAGGGRRLRAPVGPERDHGREARTAPPGPPGGARRRELRDDLLGRRGDRGHADRVDRLLVLRAGADREPPRGLPRADPVAAHMVFDRSFVLDAGSQVCLGWWGRRAACSRPTDGRASSSRWGRRCGSGRRPGPPGSSVARTRRASSRSSARSSICPATTRDVALGRCRRCRTRLRACSASCTSAGSGSSTISTWSSTRA